MTYRLELRDLEIVRTLGRLRYVTTRELLATFFSTPSVGRRRLSRLADRDLIVSHTKGLPDQLPVRAWRLTTRGLDLLSAAFPAEPVPDGLAERLADASLTNLAHREGLNRLYLKLVTHRHPLPADSDAQLLRARVAALRERAAQFSWAPDGDVVLRFMQFGEELHLVPDAMVRSTAYPVVIFVELDRSTRSLNRIADNLRRYQTFFREVCGSYFPRCEPRLLYVVSSHGRRAGIAAHARQHLSGVVAWDVLLERDAVNWLDAGLLAHIASATSATARPGVDRETATAQPAGANRIDPREMYSLARELYVTLQEHLSACPGALTAERVNRLSQICATLAAIDQPHTVSV